MQQRYRTQRIGSFTDGGFASHQRPKQLFATKDNSLLFKTGKKSLAKVSDFKNLCQVLTDTLDTIKIIITPVCPILDTSV